VNLVMRPAPPGPCWRCGAYGHLAARCTATKQYPFSQHVVDSTQHVVDSTGVSNVDAVHLLPYVSCADEMAPESVISNQCVDRPKEHGSPLLCECVDRPEDCGTPLWDEYVNHMMV